MDNPVHRDADSSVTVLGAGNDRSALDGCERTMGEVLTPSLSPNYATFTSPTWASARQVVGRLSHNWLLRTSSGVGSARITAVFDEQRFDGPTTAPEGRAA